MSKDYLTWVYHATNDPKIINNSEYTDYFDKEWRDSPACFLNLKTLGIDKDLIDKKDPDETAKAQQALEAVEGVVQSLNNQLNIDVMNKNQLEAYILEHYSIDLDKRKTLKQLRKQAKQISGA